MGGAKTKQGVFSMKNKMKVAACIFTVFVILLASCSFTDSQWGAYTTSSGATKKNNANISAYYDSNGNKIGVRLSFMVMLPDAAIPNEIAGEKVVALSFSSATGKTSVTSMTFPNTVREFDDLSGFSSLTALHLSKNLEKIHGKSLVGNTRLSTITLLSETPPEIPPGIFDPCAASLSIYVPAGSLESYKTAENWSGYAEKLVGCTEIEP